MKTIDFAENRNIYMPNIKMRLAMLKSALYAYRYPDHNNTIIHQSVSSYFKISSDYFCVTSGSLEGINLITDIQKKDTKKSIIFSPTFWGYEDALNRFECEYEILKLVDPFKYDINEINKAISNSNLIFICNPNNPTLSYIKKEDLLDLIKNNPQCYFVIDETILIFNKDFNEMSLYKEVQNYDNLSVIISFSKFLGIAGLRTGIVFSNKDVIKKIKKLKIPYSNNYLAEKVLPVALSNEDYLQNTQEKIFANKEKLVNELKSIKYNVIDNDGNFILIQLDDDVNIEKIEELLKEEGLIVRNIHQAYPSLPGKWLRITINREKDNNRLVKSLNKYRKIK